MDVQTSRTKPAPARLGSTAVSSRSTTDDGLVALGYVMSGILFYGGLGWLGWTRLGQVWMLPLGLVLGMALGTYLVYRRYLPREAVAPASPEALPTMQNPGSDPGRSPDKEQW